MATRKIKTPVKYFPHNGINVPALIFLGFIVFATIIVFRDIPMRGANGSIFILIWFGMGGFTTLSIIQSVFYNKLIVWDHGLEVYLNGSHSFVLWEDMEQLGTKKRGKGANRGIHVRRLDRLEIGWLGHILSYDKDFISLDLVVPVPRMNRFSGELDVEGFKWTLFGQDLLHFAPHLFDDEKVKHNGE